VLSGPYRNGAEPRIHVVKQTFPESIITDGSVMKREPGQPIMVVRQGTLELSPPFGQALDRE